MPVPSWFLLLWSGLAATCAAALAGSLIGGSAARPWTLLPGDRTRSAALLSTLAAGFVAYPVLYGFLFEVVGRSGVGTGLVTGAVHALIMFLAAGPRSDTRSALRVAAMHLCYGGVLAFLYVTP
jgi:hypothetical protein